MKKYFIIVQMIGRFLYGQNVDTLYSNICKSYNSINSQLVIIKDNQVDKIFKSGYADKDSLQLIYTTENTKFRISSPSMLITAIAVMRLVDQGKLKLSDSIDQYLGYSVKNPKFPKDNITIRMLLSHCSGLRDEVPFIGKKSIPSSSKGIKKPNSVDVYQKFVNVTQNASDDAIPNIEEILKPEGIYYNKDIFYNKPDSSFQFANINYAILGSIIEKVANQRFDLFCDQQIFIPLGINASFNPYNIQINNAKGLNFGICYNQLWKAMIDTIKGNKEKLNHKNPLQYKLGANGALYSPEGGLRISAKDLAIFIRMLLNNGEINNLQLLTQSSVSEILKSVFESGKKPGNTYYGYMTNYALGNFYTSLLIPKVKLVGHFGEGYGLISDMFYSPEEKWGIVYISSGQKTAYGTFSPWYKIEEEIFDISYKYIKGMLSSEKKSYTKPFEFNLSQNYPNPFNPTTTIVYSIPVESKVRLSIYNMLGQEIKVLINSSLKAGTYNSKFDASNFASGIYFARLTSDKFSKTIKMNLLK